MNISENAIAIVGIDLNIPGCQNVEEYWNVLVNSIECIEDVPKDSISVDKTNKSGSYIYRKSACKDYDKFDASFFGYSRHEAKVMDPQHRLFLQSCWKAVENAGYKVSKLEGSVGVFGSAGYNTYLINALSNDNKYVEKKGHYDILVGNDKDYLATRVSHKLGLKGPSFSVQCACSSSLVAVHLACQSLLMGESDMCLAGAANVRVPTEVGYNYQTGFFMSEDGHCRAYDDRGTGTVFGSGVGVIVLKRLEDAIADDDYIYSVIRVTSVNNDGDRKIGFTAPSFEGQTEVTQTALSLENIEPESIRFIEGHGTGTVLGDPIELNSIKNTFNLESVEANKDYPCAIGSVKSNVGHLDAAAGVVGLIKTSLCLLNKKIVPSLYFSKLNSKASFDGTRFYVADKVEEIESSVYPARAAVSAFGVGGTNVCIILEEPPCIEKNEDQSDMYLAVVSAKSEGSLKGMLDNVKTLKEKNNIGSIVYTLNSKREEFSYRSFLLFEKSKDKLSYHIVKESDIFDVRSQEELKYSMSFNETNNSNWKELYLKNAIYRRQFEDWLSALHEAGYLKFSELSEVEKNKESAELLKYISRLAFADSLKKCCSDIHFDNEILERYLEGSLSKFECAEEIIKNKVGKESKISEGNFVIEDVSEEIFYCTMGRAWTSGLKIDWEVLFAESDKKHRPAPTYEFEKERYWFEEDNSMIWREKKVLLNKVSKTINAKQFVFGKNHNLIEAVNKGLKAKNIEVICDEKWEQLSEAFNIDEFAKIVDVDKLPKSDLISLVFVINTDEMLKINETFYKYLKIFQWISKKIPANKKVVPKFVQVKGKDTNLFTDSMFLEGIISTLPKELPNIQIKQIICDSINDTVIDEIVSYDDEIKVYIEADNRYGVSFELSNSQKNSSLLKENGNYIITGGTGNVGLLFLREITKRVKANVILVSQNYNEKLLFESQNDKEIAIQDVIQQSREAGSTVEIVQVDVSNLENWNNTLNQLLQRYGKVDGVIHAAGKVGKAMDFIGDVSLQVIDDYLGAKVKGAHEINKVLLDSKFDFCIYVSSTTSLLGGIGDCVYSGANAILNQMAKERDNSNGSVFAILLDLMPRVFADKYVSSDDSKVKKLLEGQLTQEEFSNVCDSIFTNVNGENMIIAKTDFEERYLKEKEIRSYSNILEQEKKAVVKSLSEYKHRVRRVWKQILEISCEENINFFDAGGDSFLAVKVIAELNKEFSVSLPIQFIYEFSTIELMANELYESQKGDEGDGFAENYSDISADDKISTYVVGMAGRFPDASSIDELWNNLLDGKRSISHFEKDEFENVLLAEPDGKHNKYVGARGILQDIDKFDFGFFGISKLEAQLMDPQQRLFIESVWNALEDAGCINMLDKARIGVFASQGISTYLLNVLLKSNKIKGDYNNVAVLNNSPDSLATRVSYLLNLTGVSKTIQSFCSSSMVALEDAITYIEKGKCDVAVVGGTNIVVPQKSGYIYNEGSICSETGDIRSFDDRADGTVFGNGVAVVVLASDSWVKKNRLHSYAEIVGVGINNDGSQKASYLSPSVKGQAECVAEAYSKAGISSTQVSYIETHGTATHVGDPIEITALKKSFKCQKSNEQMCAIGSIKGNLGHLDRAAGVTSFIKACLVAEKRCIPPLVGFEKINEHINFEETPFYINKEIVNLDKSKDIYVGVTALGVGGTNVHIVLKSTQNEETASDNRKKCIIPFSAKCEESLVEEKKIFTEFLMNNKVDIHKLAYAMQMKRKDFPIRESYLVENSEELVEKLTRETRKNVGKKINTIIVSNYMSDKSLAITIQKLLDEEQWLKESVYDRFGFDDKNVTSELYEKHGKDILKYCINNSLKTILSDDIIVVFTDEKQKKNMLIDERTICIELDENVVEENSELKIQPNNIGPFGNILSEIWQSGIDVDWEKYNNYLFMEHIHLPGYAFKKTKCWID
ncbi:SDR family NAD(P)-dependent oxidoreductase [Eubacterium sp.]|uniref:SDR family NAD(P)-dependent oxidoreductase n=1 Tax=Eubacterium sp. TaxID=142586 RepID=UPI00351FB86F